ncbi:hypothetical protein S40293_06581 [Stachybotrys chartarum IBT 40293]|nr:hypothetical protein S40293_06581 [Stachybotrys chartarum IBT 40293]
MADPLGIIGVIGVAAQIIQFGVHIATDWASVPADVKAFLAELHALKLTLSETHANVLANPDFRASFTGHHSVLLSSTSSGGPVSELLALCSAELTRTLRELEARAAGGGTHGWGRLKGAFLATGTKEAVEALNRLAAIDSLALEARTHEAVRGVAEEQARAREEQEAWRVEDGLAMLTIAEGVDMVLDKQTKQGQWLGRRMAVFDQIAAEQQDAKMQQIVEWFSNLQYRERHRYVSKSRHKGTGGFLLKSREFTAWVYFVIDALDECIEANGTRSALLTHLVNLDAVKTQLLFTSRPLGRIKILQEATEFEIMAQGGDMRQFLKGQIAQESRLADLCAKHAELEEEITEQIIAKADGMFLLARLHIQSIANQLRLKTVRKALGALPEKLSDTYDDTLERIKSGQEKEQAVLAMKVLMLLTFIHELPTLVELQHALLTMELEEGETIDPDDVYSQDLLLAICGGLIILEDETILLRFVHHTAEAYFEANRGKLFENGHTQVTKICLDYLSFQEFESGPCASDEEYEERLASHPFYKYAATRWGYHARESKHTSTAVRKFLHSEGNMRAAAQVTIIDEESHVGDFGYSQQYPRGITPLHLAIFFGLREIANSLMSYADDKDGYRMLPLARAARQGYVDIMEMLIDNGAEPDHAIEDAGMLEDKGSIDFGEELWKTLAGRTPLSFAAERGGQKRNEAVRLLLDKGADPLSKAHLLLPGWENMFMRIHYWFNWTQVVATTPWRDSSTGTTNLAKGHTPICFAAVQGHASIVKILLDRLDDIETVLRNYGGTWLAYAAAEGHQDLLQLLLEKGVHPNARARMLPLAQPPLRSDSSDEPYLLGKRYKKSTAGKILPENRGQLPLTCAAWNGHVESVRLLLATGRVDVNLTDDLNRTALMYAVDQGHEPVVEVLIGVYNINLGLQDMDSREAIYHAAAGGNVTLFNLLLGSGATLEAHPESLPPGWSTRWVSFTKPSKSGGRVERETLHYRDHITETIIPADPRDFSNKRTMEDKVGGHLLMIAAHKGRVPILEILLGANEQAVANAVDQLGRTAVMFAAEAGHEDAMRLLLNTGKIDVNAIDDLGNTALYYAKRGWCHGVVAMLREYGALDVKEYNDYVEEGQSDTLVEWGSAEEGEMEARNVRGRDNPLRTPSFM